MAASKKSKSGTQTGAAEIPVKTPVTAVEDKTGTSGTTPPQPSKQDGSKGSVEGERTDGGVADVQIDTVEVVKGDNVAQPAAKPAPPSGKVVWNIPRFTIIIPCHNNAGYIVRCLSSVKKQTFDLGTVEVIAVNDGSTDGSGEILAMMGRDLPNFKLLNNETPAGAGAARNQAVKVATGKYVWFVDCDDWVTEKALERIDIALKAANDPDVACLPFTTVKVNNVKSPFVPKWTNIQQIVVGATGPWAQVVKRSLLIPFPINCRGEDTVWHYPQFDKFNSYCIVTGDEPCYMYDRTNSSAITDTLEWSAQNALTLEHLAKENDAVKAGKNDKFFSDIVRAIAEMYDSRHQITKPWIRAAWFIRFQSMYGGMVCGHFHN